jgi:hypothetical protein
VDSNVCILMVGGGHTAIHVCPNYQIACFRQVSLIFVRCVLVKLYRGPWCPFLSALKVVVAGGKFGFIYLCRIPGACAGLLSAWCFREREVRPRPMILISLGALCGLPEEEDISGKVHLETKCSRTEVGWPPRVFETALL